uniref:Coatomer subunit zeta n=1 Tax=Amazona collaria TaxID=241587 RepID=A0A8B9IT56_9PSIT
MRKRNGKEWGEPGGGAGRDKGAAGGPQYPEPEGGGGCPGLSPPGPQEPSLYTVKALLVLDSLGQRLLAKYYDSTFPTAKEQSAFERSIFMQSQRAGGEVASMQGLTVVYRSSGDLCFYVVGGGQENELMLLSVLTCLLDLQRHGETEAGHPGMRGSGSRRLTWDQKEVEKRWLLDNMEGTFLVVDEIVDRGVILESDPQQVVQRLSLRVRAPILLHGLPLSCLLPAPSSPSLPPRSPSQHPTASSSLTTCQAARSRRTQGTATNKQH